MVTERKAYTTVSVTVETASLIDALASKRSAKLGMRVTKADVMASIIRAAASREGVPVKRARAT